MPDRAAVVTCFLRNRGEVLLLRRAPDASTYPGRWGAVSGSVEHDDPLDTALAEIAEETGRSDVDLVRRGEPFAVADGDADREWAVTPFLFDAPGREVRPNEETDRFEWTRPTAILRRETVPRLWTSWDRVRPTAERVAADHEHGSAAVSIDALWALRDAAGAVAVRGGDLGEVTAVAEALLSARPSMAALGNRVNRAMSAAETPGDVERAADAGIERAHEADGAAASEAAAVLSGAVLTLSRSGTVRDALLAAAPAAVVAESRPAREGVPVAEHLAAAGLDVTLCPDAAAAHLLAEGREGDVDAVLVGADTILPDGRVVNKTGTRGIAIAAAREAVPVYVVAASDKISTAPEVHLESGDPGAVYDGPADLRVSNPTFDVTPADLVTRVFTDRGTLTVPQVVEVADDLRDLASWRDR